MRYRDSITGRLVGEETAVRREFEYAMQASALHDARLHAESRLASAVTERSAAYWSRTLEQAQSGERAFLSAARGLREVAPVEAPADERRLLDFFESFDDEHLYDEYEATVEYEETPS